MPQFAPDGNPTIDGCRPAVLRVMADGADRSLRQIIEAVGEHLRLDEGVLSQRISSGQTRLENRVGWACSSFYRAGLMTKPRRGWYRITADGLAVDRRDLTEYTEEDLKEWEQWRTYLLELNERRARAGADPGIAEAAPNIEQGVDVDPLELIEEGVNNLNGAVETELRQALQEASPTFFEKAVLEVLWAMGYGGGQGMKEHVGRSHDGGIDGVIRQDPLGLQNVYVQAKRYADANTVGSADVNGFFGALSRRGADRGVFITTSSFSAEARRAAEQLGNRIILIDGIQLTSLMLRYGVGVEPQRVLTVFEVNQDFFDEDV